MQGGYLFSLPFEFIEDNFYSVNYWYLEEKNVPKLEEIEKEISDLMEFELDGLTNNISIAKIEKEKPKVRINFEDNVTIAEIHFPIVLIGHSKGFYFKETFEYLLKKKELSFFALSDAVKKIKILNEKSLASESF